MKKLVLLVALLMSANAMAANIAEYRFAQMGEERGSVHVFKVAVTDSAELDIELTTSVGRPPFYLPQDGEVNTKDFSKRLNKHVFETLKNHIVSLSSAEIEERMNQIVCMMMPGPAQSNNHLSVKRDYDYRTQEFKGEMQLVSGPNGCWVRHAIFPKVEWQRANAQALKNLIKVLTLDHVGDEL